MAAARTQEIATYLSRGSTQGSVDAKLLATHVLFACAQASVRREAQKACGAQGEQGEDSCMRSKENPDPSPNPDPNPYRALTPTLTPTPQP